MITRVQNYLTDGMPYQPQMVLTYIRAHEINATEGSWNGHEYEVEIFVSPYEYGREKGYVFSIHYLANGEWEQHNYAVYTHCVSDEICVMMSTTGYNDCPTGWEGREWTKYNQDKNFDCDDVVACGKFIIDDMKKVVFNWYNK